MKIEPNNSAVSEYIQLNPHSERTLRFDIGIASKRQNIKYFTKELHGVAGFVSWCYVSKYTIISALKYKQTPSKLWEKDEGNILYIEHIYFDSRPSMSTAKKALREMMTLRRAVYFKNKNKDHLWIFGKKTSKPMTNRV